MVPLTAMGAGLCGQLFLPRLVIRTGMACPGAQFRKKLMYQVCSQVQLCGLVMGRKDGPTVIHLLQALQIQIYFAPLNPCTSTSLLPFLPLVALFCVPLSLALAQDSLPEESPVCRPGSAAAKVNTFAVMCSLL
jgi:hypothetical protein